MIYEYENKLFENLDLVETSVSGIEFIDCTFQNCCFENLEILNCTFQDCTFRSCRIVNVSGQRSLMRSSIFESCTLTSINWSHWSSGSSFFDPFTKLDQCRIKYNQFVEMNLTRFDFSRNEIRDSLFAECQLANSKFLNCGLEQTEFFRCDLAKSDFRNATGYRVDISTCQLKGAKFSFPEVTNLLYSLGIKIE